MSHGVNHELNKNRLDFGHEDALRGVRHELNASRVDIGLMLCYALCTS